MALSIAVRFKKRQHISFVETSNAPQGGDGRAHLAAFQGAEETHGNAGGMRHFGEGKTATHPKAAKPLTCMLRGIRGCIDQPLFLQDVDDGGRV